MTFYDSNGDPVEVRSDPALVCRCGYDNNPLPTDPVPDTCEGCGERL